MGGRRRKIFGQGRRRRTDTEKEENISEKENCRGRVGGRESKALQKVPADCGTKNVNGDYDCYITNMIQNEVFHTIIE